MKKNVLLFKIMNEESTITPPLEFNIEQKVNSTANVPEVAIASL